jgi:hypothetical protein
MLFILLLFLIIEQVTSEAQFRRPTDHAVVRGPMMTLCIEVAGQQLAPLLRGHLTPGLPKLLTTAASGRLSTRNAAEI